MKRCLTVACLLMLVASSVAGAATKGDKELLFGFSGLTNLGVNNFEGGIGLRHYISDNMAVRPSVNLNFSSNKVDGQGGNTDQKVTGTGVGVSVAMEKHMGGSKNISPYIGAGVDVGFGSTKWEWSHPATPANGTNLSTTDSGMGFGVFGLAGFTWSWTEGLSLGGEYQLGLGSNSSKTENEFQGQPTITNKSSGFGLGLGTAQLSLSVAL